MNPWKLNSISGFLFRQAICRKFNIHHTEVYKQIREVNGEIILDKNGKKYSLELIEIRE